LDEKETKRGEKKKTTEIQNFVKRGNRDHSFNDLGLFRHCTRMSEKRKRPKKQRTMQRTKR
jgi:hypothetical protein